MNRFAMIGILSLVAGHAAPGCAQGTAPAGASGPPTTQPLRDLRAVQAVPWIEVAANKAAFEDAVHGLLIWQLVTDQAIVLVERQDAVSLWRITQRVPGIHIIPSIRTHSFVESDVESIAGWREIAKRAKQLCEWTGSRRVVLENEGTMQEYIDGKYQINWDRLRTALEALPKDIQFLWYPANAGPKLPKYEQMSKLIGEMPNMQFIDHGTLWGPGSYENSTTIECQEALKKLSPRAPVMMIYCCGEKYWPIDRVPEAMKHAEGDEVIVYPGATRWVEAAQKVSQLIPPVKRATTQPATTQPAGVRGRSNQPERKP